MSKEEKSGKTVKLVSEIRPVKESEEAALLKRSGVTGVDIGYKYVKGKKTDELAIRVYVEQKKDVPKSEMIPKTINGVKTDVIQRKFVLHPLKVKLTDIAVMADTGRYDPLKGGISIGPCRAIGGYIFAGTLGAIVIDNSTGKEMLLSNFHVMCVDDTWTVGNTMCQPSRIDTGVCPGDVVGTLQRASLGGKVDCAVASHTARGYACEIVDIGKVAGKATATVGMAVRKRGRTTGLTYGTVDTVDLTVNIPYGDGLGVVTLTKQIGIDVDSTKSAKFGIHGDSGSVVVDNSRRIVGLYFAGNDEQKDATGKVIQPEGVYGVANPIQAVLDALNVRICAPKLIEKVKDHLKEIWEPPEWEKIIKTSERLEKAKEYEKTKEHIEKYKPENIKPEVEKYKGGIPTIPTPPSQPGPIEGPIRGSNEERIASLEATVTQLSHFIGSMLRPDLAESALKYEPEAETEEQCESS